MADALRDGQAKILEMIAMSAPLGDVLAHLVLLVESQLKGFVGAVLLLDETGMPIAARRRAEPAGRLRQRDRRRGDRSRRRARSARPPISREAVIVVDVMSDPLSEDYRGLAAEYGLRSAWSTPILTHSGASSAYSPCTQRAA